jgi:hypothetical protein
MTAIGVVNIVLGVIGCLFSLLVLVGGGVLAAGGGEFAAQAGGDESFGMMAQGAGLMVVVIGFVGLITWLLTMISGIGVLMMRSWGRTLAMLCGAVLIVVNVLSLVNGGFGIMTIATLIYGAMLVGLFMKPSWKMAFSGGEAMIESAPATDADDDMRAAA